MLHFWAAAPGPRRWKMNLVLALKECVTSRGGFYFSMPRSVPLSVVRASSGAVLPVNLEWVRPIHCVWQRKAVGLSAPRRESWTWTLQSFSCEQHFDFGKSFSPLDVFCYLALHWACLLCSMCSALISASRWPAVKTARGWALKERLCRTRITLTQLNK